MYRTGISQLKKNMMFIRKDTLIVEEEMMNPRSGFPLFKWLKLSKLLKHVQFTLVTQTLKEEIINHK